MKSKYLAFLSLIPFLLILFSCMSPSVSVVDYTLTKVFNARFVIPEGGIENGYVQITAVFKTSDGTMDEDIANAILDSVHLERIYNAPVEISNPEYEIEDTNDGKVLVVEWKDGLDDIKDAIKDGDTIKYKLTLPESLNVKGKTYVVPEDSRVLERTAEVVKPEESFAVRGPYFTPDAVKFTFENVPSDTVVKYSVIDEDGNVIYSGESTDVLYIPYSEVEAAKIYTLKADIVKATRGEEIEDSVESPFYIPDNPIVSADVERDPSNLTTVHVSLDLVDVVDEIYYKVEEITDEFQKVSEEFTVENVPNDKVYNLVLKFIYKTGQEFQTSIPIKVHLTRSPALEVELKGVEDSKRAGGILQGMSIELSDDMNEFLRNVMGDFDVQMTFYVEGAHNEFLTKYYKTLVDFFGNRPAVFYVYDPQKIRESNSNLYNAISSVFSDDEVYKNVHYIVNKKVKVIASVVPKDGNLSDYFENPELLSDIEAETPSALKGAVFAKFVPALIETNLGKAEITISATEVNSAFPESGQKFLVVYFKEETGTRAQYWGYVIYDINSESVFKETYNEIPVVVGVALDDEKLDMSVDYKGKDYLTLYYAFISDFNYGYWNWSPDFKADMVDSYLGNYANIVGTLHNMIYDLPTDYNEYFLPPIEIDENTVRISKNLTKWTDEESVIAQAYRSAYIIRVQFVLKDRDGNVISRSEFFTLERSYYDIQVPEPGVEYSIEAELYGEDTTDPVKTTSGYSFIKRLMLRVPSLNFSNIVKDKENGIYSMDVSVDPIPSNANVYYLVVVNKDAPDYDSAIRIVEMTSKTHLENLSLNSRYSFVVVPWIEGKFSYLEKLRDEGVINFSETNIVDYIKEHIAKQLYDNKLLEARDYYYKVITEKLLEEKKLLIRDKEAQKLDSSVEGVLYLSGGNLAMKLNITIDDPNDPEQFQSYEVRYKVYWEGTIYASGTVDGTSTVVDLGEVSDLPENLIVEIYPHYTTFDGEEEDGDSSIHIIETPPVLNWDEFSVEYYVDPEYRKKGEAIIIEYEIPENSDMIVIVKDRASQEVYNQTFENVKGDGLVTVEELDYAADYKVTVKVRVKIYDDYNWESESDKEEYTEKTWESDWITTKPVISAVDFATTKNMDFAGRYAYIYMDSNMVTTNSFSAFLRLNKDKESVFNYLEGISVGYSQGSNQDSDGKLDGLTEAIEWDQDELKEILDRSESWDEKKASGLVKGTQYYFQIVTRIRAREGYIAKYSTVKTISTASYFKDIDPDDVEVTENENGIVNGITIPQFKEKYLSETNGIKPDKNFYVVEVIVESKENEPEEVFEYTLDSMPLDEIGNFVFPDEVMRYIVTYQRVYVHIYPLSEDPVVIEDIGSPDEQRDKFGVGIVVTGQGFHYEVRRWRDL